MCVIAVADTSRLNEAQVGQMWRQNKEGAGIAYRENGRVHWRKGLSEQEIHDLALTVPLPYVAHFRIATCGGARPSLTHPFPIARDVPLHLKGSTSGYVLFHNGHWSKWKESTLDTLAKFNLKMPAGKWSDSRAMAWAAANYGINVLELIDEKCVAFGLKDIEVFGNGWGQTDNGIVVSNKSWEPHTSYNYSTLCADRFCRKPKLPNSSFCFEHQPELVEKEEKKPIVLDPTTVPVGGAPKPTTFRGGESAVRLGPDQQEAVEAGEEEAGEVDGEGAVSARTLKEGNRIVSWVRSLNPSPLRTPRRFPPAHL